MDRLTSMLQRPNEDLVAKDNVASWKKMIGRGLGFIAGINGLLMGLVYGFFNLLSFGLVCVLTSLLLVVTSISMLVFEVPVFFSASSVALEVSNFVENRPYWNRALFYLVSAIVIFVPCKYHISAGLILATGLWYGFMSIGRTSNTELTEVTSPGTVRGGDSSLMEDPDVWHPA